MRPGGRPFGSSKLFCVAPYRTGVTDPAVVVVADLIDPEAIRKLRAAGLEVVDASNGSSALDAALPRAWALVVRSRTKVTAATLERAGKLRVVARAGVGVDNVDVPAATARKVQVVNAPTAATSSVAELTVALILLLVRGLVPPIIGTHDGQWRRGSTGAEFEGRSVGFVGYGRIAREVARRLQPFGGRRFAFDPFVRATDDGTELVSLERLLGESDIVSLHAALTPENHHLIDAARLRQMRPSAFLVNVARGGLVDESALRQALDEGTIAGAALDVFEEEPPRTPGLLQHPKVIATPHLGASTPEAQRRAGDLVAEELLRIHRGENPKFLVNPDVG